MASIPPIDPFQALQALGALGSMISAAGSVLGRQGEGAPPRRLDPKDREEIQLQGRFGSERLLRDPEVPRVLASIPPQILNPSVDRINRALERFSTAISRTSFTTLDLERESEIASEEICDLLRLIRRHNEGRLPSELEDLWDSFNCDNRTQRSGSQGSRSDRATIPEWVWRRLRRFLRNLREPPPT